MAAATELDFEMHKGDTQYITVNVTHEDGTDKSLVAVTSIKWQMAKRSKGTPILSKAIGSGVQIVGAPADGVVKVSIDPEDTEDLKPMDYYHELEVVDSDGDVQTVLIGALTLLPALIANT
jgi:hypothetical protein